MHQWRDLFANTLAQTTNITSSVHCCLHLSCLLYIYMISAAARWLGSKNNYNSLQIKQEKHNYLSRSSQTSERWPKAHNHPQLTPPSHLAPLPSHKQRNSTKQMSVSEQAQKKKRGETVCAAPTKAAQSFGRQQKHKSSRIFFPHFRHAQ